MFLCKSTCSKLCYEIMVAHLYTTSYINLSAKVKFDRYLLFLDIWFRLWILNKKGFYNRETFAALNYEIQPMTFITFYEAQIINSYLNLRISPNHDKVDGLSANCEILIKSIDSLL